MLLRMLSAVLAAGLLLSEVPVPAAEPPVLPILMYHEVKHDRLGKDVITPAEFESDLVYLQREGYTPITFAEVLAFVYAGAPLPPKPIMLSFDDGYLSNYVHVLPLLKKHQVKIVLSIIGKSTDEFTQIPSDDLRFAHVSWDQLREMADSGLVELQNHTYNLHRYDGGCRGCTRMAGESEADYAHRLSSDLEKLQENLYAAFGRAPVAFAYPYGLQSELTEGTLRELGFLATLTCDFGVNRLSQDPDCLFGLKRICRVHGKKLDKLLSEAYHTLRAA